MAGSWALIISKFIPATGLRSRVISTVPALRPLVTVGKELLEEEEFK
jgi:hypothetical protein